jgi:hypothetical protein
MIDNITYPYDTIKKMVEEAVFYGLGDEAYELWTDMCGVCYQMAGLGNIQRASLLADWIVEDAKKSEYYWKDNCEGLLGEPFENVEKANGVWGYK